MKRYDEAAGYAALLLAGARSDDDRARCETLVQMVKGRREMLLEAKRRQEEQARTLQELANRRMAEEQSRARSAAAGDARQEPDAGAAPGQDAPPAARTGPVMKVEGVVSGVLCDDPATMEVTVETGRSRLKLHADNYHKVQYWAVGKAGRNDFQPCSELNGAQVEITYWPAAGQSCAGEIKSLAIRK